MINPFRRQAPFLTNTLKLVAGAGAGQIISLAISPFLTRIYAPHEFGVYAFYISIVGGFGLITTLRYEMAIILQEREDEAVNMASLSFFIALVISCILWVVVAGLSWFYPGFAGTEVPGAMMYLLPLLVLLVGAGNIFQHWFNRKGRYTALAAGKVFNSAGNNGGMLLLGLLGAGVWGLVGGFTIGSVLFVLFFIFLLIYTDRHLLKGIRFASFPGLLKRHRDLPLANSPQVVVEMLQNYGIIYLARVFFDAAIIGWYSLAMRILQAPLLLIATSLSQVFYKDAAEQYKTSGQIRDIVWKTVKLSFVVALPVLLTLMIAGPSLFGWVFGESWRESGIYARILAPWMFFDFIRYSIAQIPLILRRTRTMFYFAVAGNVFMILSIGAGGLIFHSIVTGFILLSVTMSAYAITVITWILSITKPTRIIP